MSEIERLKCSLAETQQALLETQQELERIKCVRDREMAHGDLLAVRMRQLLDLLPAGVILIDKQGLVSECNPAAEDLLGEPLRGELWMRVIQRSFAPQNDDGHEISLKDGRRVSILTRAMADEPGQVVLLTDQTGTRLLQSRLSQYQRLSEMGRMMASLAHQIRTPLSAALLYASHLGADNITDPQRKKFALKVKSRLLHLEHQVQDMLLFARGETKLDDRVSIEQLFQAIDDVLDVPLAQYDADCELENLAAGYWLQCNQETLIGAILNLVNNALQAAGNDKPLRIVASVDGKNIMLRVIDAGPGMDSATIKRALEPFFTTKSHGTGLGLAVAQVVAKAHHGEFSLFSYPESGTIAQFCLPFIDNLTAAPLMTDPL
ncbi:sensor histidine kinase [Neptunomonas antarctica]|uniref:histidine kinase n=1 Tax=Neptunomonas antarctica TaxID=619304 RepID=A0A1N7JC26_9GAMM|nr:ATP-binding protein [Neptunomonas antarctica]SIS46860.1 PAS/PAC sensor signal transduction histidine kinase [Neptunomonas antarctica]